MISTIPYFTEAVKAGFPSPAADYKEDNIDLNSLLIKNKSATYMVRVSGDSMNGAGILPGDILVVDRSLNPNQNDIVIASVDGAFTVKRFVQSHKKITLHPENPLYEDIVVAEHTDCQFFGVVTSVLRLLKEKKL